MKHKNKGWNQTDSELKMKTRVMFKNFTATLINLNHLAQFTQFLWVNIPQLKLEKFIMQDKVRSLQMYIRYVKLYSAWSSFSQNWDRHIINKIYYYVHASIFYCSAICMLPFIWLHSVFKLPISNEVNWDNESHGGVFLLFACFCPVTLHGLCYTSALTS